MKELNWDQIQEIYHEALKLPPAERNAFIARAAKQNPTLMREVNELVSVGASLGDFLQTPIAELPVTAPVEDLTGTKLKDRYVIDRELGSGGMGQLYLAHDQNVDNRPVVVKFLLRELMENADALQKFKDESRALSRIHHPNVVEVKDTGELSDGRPFFVMQYIDGETLDQRIPKEGMPLAHAASILKQIGAALEHVHEKGVFHRDLKPGNIMLRRGTDSVVLVDFGIAKVIDADEAEGVTDISAGTLVYMPPEQINGEETTAASDIYSMAVVAYEMVTGRRPFEPASPSRFVAMQRKGLQVKPRVLRPTLSQKAQDEILHGLAFKPSARYQNAKQFGDELAQSLLNKGPNGVPWARVAMAVLGVALLSFGVYKYWTRPIVRPPNRSFDYFVTVQRKRDGRPYQNPYQSHGEETFNSGDDYRLTVTTHVDAFLYVFKDGSLNENGASFKMIFPRQSTNNGSATVGADKSFETEWMTFSESAGVENFWIVWSTTPVPELETVKNEAFKDAGGLTGNTLANVKQYLTKKKAEIDATTYNYNGNQTAIVRAPHDLLVALAQFKHR
jgi:serine/threonine protein kinase